jgi:epoxyqueuosine reductase QueG
MADFLKKSGYKAVPQTANFVYRRDTENWLLDMHPPISHRHIVVRPRIRYFKYSGNIITKEYGSAIDLVSVVTDAALIPTNPLPEEKNYCDEGKLCLSVCSSGYVDPIKKVTVTLGGKEFSYGKRRSNSRCLLVCGGLTGLKATGKWSSWSPGSFKIPKKMKISFLQYLSPHKHTSKGRSSKANFLYP